MNNTAKILLASGAATVLVAGVVHVVKTSNTADKLNIVLDSFSLKSKKLSGLGLTIKIPKIIFDADLTIHNPTTDELVISKPYLKVFYQDNPNPIGVSSASDKTYVLKGKKATPVNADVEFSADNVLPVMPDFLKYVISRIGGKKASRKVTLEISTSGNGIDQTTRKEILI